MSLQVLGDVQLITRQEVEAMLDCVVPTEDEIDAKVATETEARELSESIIKSSIDQLSARHEADKLEFEDKLADEAQLRSVSDQGLRDDLEQEAAKRHQADIDLVNAIEEFRQFEEAVYPTAIVEKIKGLPIAILHIHNTDKSLHIGDIIATVDEKYFPRRSVDFVMFVEQVEANVSKTCMIACRLDNNGNIIIIDMFDVANHTSATDSVSILYFTEE